MQVFLQTANTTPSGVLWGNLGLSVVLVLIALWLYNHFDRGIFWLPLTLVAVTVGCLLSANILAGLSVESPEYWGQVGRNVVGFAAGYTIVTGCWLMLMIRRLTELVLHVRRRVANLHLRLMVLEQAVKDDAPTP